MNTVQIITRSVRIDKSLLRLVTIRGIGQSSPNLGVKTKRKKSRNDECTEISCGLSLPNFFTRISVLKTNSCPCWEYLGFRTLTQSN